MTLVPCPGLRNTVCQDSLQTMSGPNEKYLPEIDGLRALAILSVLVFHLDSGWLPGGFLGVDIFFVISGF